MSKMKRSKVLRFLPVLMLLAGMIAVNHLSAQAAAKVASIGSKKYTSLQTAVNRVKNGQTIKLLKDIKVTQTIKSKKRNIKYTINLNKHKLSGDGETSALAFTKGNSVTLKNGTIVSKKTYGGIPLITVDQGSVTIDGCTCSSGDSVFEVSKGKLTVKKGTIQGRMAAQDTSTVTVKGGTWKKAHFNLYGSTLTIKGGTFTIPGDYTCAIYMAGAKLMIQGGTIKISSNIYDFTEAWNSQIVMTGGKIRATKDVDIFHLRHGATLVRKGGTVSTKGKVVFDQSDLDDVEDEPDDPDDMDDPLDDEDPWDE